MKLNLRLVEFFPKMFYTVGTMRILVIEDDPHIKDILVTNLKASCFAVDATDDGEHGSYLARTNDYDLIILDYMLPKKDGRIICQEIREHGKTVPIIMLSVKSSTEDKVDLLTLGVDDYMSKPFSFEELHARIKALLRRPHETVEPTIKIGAITIDSNRQVVLCKKEEIYLTRKEFALLEYLARHREHVVSRGMIMEHVWDLESDLFSNTIEAHILNIRKKLGLKKHQLIQTVPGRGYKIESV
jgi:DNA-binding response OmpR family regulator